MSFTDETTPDETTADPAHEGVLSPEEVMAEKERVLAQREAELARREKLLNMQPSARVASEAEFRDAGIVAARKAAAFYCPGCGAHAGYPKECVGSKTGPHPPIEMVSTAELDGDPLGHTAAPPSENVG